MNKKVVALVLACVLIFSTIVAGTLAWLQDKTETITNTFTYGKVDIDLVETTEDFKMVPGQTIDKDPVITVKAGSEPCWVFVKVEESANLGTFIDYSLDIANWKRLDSVNDAIVYYKQVDDATAEVTLNVLTDEEVSVKNSVTTADINGLAEPGALQPSLAFTGYAVQQDATIADAAAAWNLVKNM